MSVVCGLDPGLQGGLAILGHPPCVVACPLPIAAKGVDVVKLKQIMGVYLVDLVALEISPPFKQGRTSAWTSGRGLGRIEGAISALGIRLELVRPQDWKAVILKGTAKDKDAAIAWAMRTYPTVELVLPGCRKAHDGMADALCIATYAYDKRNGASA